MILIGSRAANYWHPDHWPDPMDTDYICTYEEFTDWLVKHKDLAKTYYPINDGSKYIAILDRNNKDDIYEFELAWPDSTGEWLINLLNDHAGTITIPSMDWLFTIKYSHRYKKDCPHFEKTIYDYHLMKQLGCKIANHGWLLAREKNTYKNKLPKLNQSKLDFFSNDGIEYVFNHDSIHVCVAKYAFNDTPAYLHYQTDNAEVMFSKSKWLSCSDRIKLRGAIEEAYVLALERSAIPYRGEISPFDSFKIALSKIATSITSGIFREFVYENYFSLLEIYSDQYVNWFDLGRQNGIIKPFRSESEK